MLETVLWIRDVLFLIPDPDPNIFSFQIPDPDPNILHPGYYIKKEGCKVKTTFFHAYYGFRKKSLKSKR
jgi:hypothetical protein